MENMRGCTLRSPHSIDMKFVVWSLLFIHYGFFQLMEGNSTEKFELSLHPFGITEMKDRLALYNRYTAKSKPEKGFHFSCFYPLSVSSVGVGVGGVGDIGASSSKQS